MRKVFVVNRSGHDFSDAESFGELVTLSRGRIGKFSVTQMGRTFIEVLEDSAPDDYILVTGLTCMNMVAAAIFTHLHGRVNLLLYSPSREKYVARTLVMDELLQLCVEDDMHGREEEERAREA